MAITDQGTVLTGRGEVNHKAVARHMDETGLVDFYPGPNLSKRAHQAWRYRSLSTRERRGYCRGAFL